ncbi:OmpH family outer membrane protein [Flavisphingomonas formosensis]|uniref:OmpH family outer membrane protein n=1 Tax=Flavisphingomonas formosensis TaxID=861534 RepID=UPI0012FB2E3F|nr:OmpH family outer membrane protein [Sphingomonas formosensis]
MSTAIVAPAHAQAVPAASIVLVDMEDVINSCNAGKGAQTQLQAQANALQSRVQQLRTGFDGEEQALQKAVDGKTMTQPQIEAKAKDLQTREAAAQNEIGTKQRQLQLNQQYVVKQINDAAQPIITAIMKEKGANIALARGATLQASDALDITNLVTTRLNSALPSVQVNAPAQPAAPAAKSQGR